MNTTVFELNDTGIYCNGQQGSALISPGYALLTNGYQPLEALEGPLEGWIASSGQ